MAAKASGSLARSEIAPNVSVTLAIEPPVIRRSSEDRPTLFVTIVSHASQPVTVFTWPTILHLQLAIRRKNFECLDLTEGGQSVHREATKGPRRYGFAHYKGCNDDEFHVTLFPGTPVTFQHKFTPSDRTSEDNRLKPDHKYLFGVAKDETIDWWCYGTRDEVLGERGSSPPDPQRAITISNVTPVELIAEE